MDDPVILNGTYQVALVDFFYEPAEFIDLGEVKLYRPEQELLVKVKAQNGKSFESIIIKINNL